MKLFRRVPLLLALLASIVVGGAVYAQLEGAERGIPPIDSASTFEITGIEVDVTASRPQQEWAAGGAQTTGLADVARPGASAQTDLLGGSSDFGRERGSPGFGTAPGGPEASQR